MLRISLLHSRFPRHSTIIKCVSKHDLTSVCGIALITKAYIICYFSTVMYILFMAMDTFPDIYGELFVLFSICTEIKKPFFLKLTFDMHVLLSVGYLTLRYSQCTTHLPLSKKHCPLKIQCRR